MDPLWSKGTSRETRQLVRREKSNDVPQAPELENPMGNFDREIKELKKHD